MLESLSLEEENIIKDILNLFRLKKELKYTLFIDIKNLSRLEKETKAIKDRILTGIQNFFEHQKEANYYKAARVNIFWSNNYTEYEGNGDRN